MWIHHLAGLPRREDKARLGTGCARRFLLEELKRIHAENYCIYHVRKMHQAMRRAGWEIGRDQVARLMKTAGLQGAMA